VSNDQTPTVDGTQRTIDERHRALWIALHDADAEAVVTAKKLMAMPPPSQIEWMKRDDGSALVIRAVASAG
jgi:hypothetical protein